MIRISLVTLLLCFLSQALALFTPNLQKKHFYVSPDNHFSQELFSTPHGIIAHSIENDQNQTHFFSKYVLIDVQSREATVILDDIVNECEVAAPVFQHLHYHNQTDSLVYFCIQNGSLLILDQSNNYTVQNSIAFNTQGSWPIAKLSTDGQNITILRMDTLFSDNAQNSVLLQVDMQAMNIVAEISLQTDDPVVAFASTQDAAYVATARNISSDSSSTTLRTTVYSLVTTSNNAANLTELVTLNSSIADQPQVITKLFCIGDFIAINSNQDLFLIYKTGNITQNTSLTTKPITSDLSGFLQPLMTSQYNNTDLYVISSSLVAQKYSFDGKNVATTKIGSYLDMQVAFGNKTLMFALNSSIRTHLFSIVDLQTLQTIYKTTAGFTDGILTDTTYSIVEGFSIYIFDRSNETLIASIPMNKNYYYSKEQTLVSFFLAKKASPICNLYHVNVTTGETWSSLEVTRPEICHSTILTLTFNQFGPQFAVSAPPTFVIYAFCNGFAQFIPLPQMINDTQALNNIVFNLFIGFYFYDANPNYTNISATKYIYQGPFYKFKAVKDNVIKNVSATLGFFPINETDIIALSNDTLTIIKDLGQERAPEKHSISTEWNSASVFQDDHDAHYVILSQNGSNTTLFTAGNFVSLSGVRNENSTAKAAGYQSYWVADAPIPSIGLARFYSVSGSSRDEEKTLISM